MAGISLKVMTHNLNMNPFHTPNRQSKRKYRPFRNQEIEEKVSKLLKIGSINEVKYPD